MAIFLLALGGQAIAGHNLYNEEALAHQESQFGFWRYLTSSSGGQAVMENWQSEFLAVGSFAILAVYLRQRGSPESLHVSSRPHLGKSLPCCGRGKWEPSRQALEPRLLSRVPSKLCARSGVAVRTRLACDGLVLAEERLRMGELLAIYLNDHLAGATAGVELARRLRASNEGDLEFGPELVEICAEVETDRETLKRVMDRLGVGQSKLKPAAAVLGERLGRLKPNGQLRGYSPLSRLDELELLQIGVMGKRRLWRALEHTHAADLSGFELGALVERATSQLRRLEGLHLKAASLAL